MVFFLPVLDTKIIKFLRPGGHDRVLGITADENLKFNKHVEDARTKAFKSLSSVSRLLDETGGVRTELGLQLYKGLVFPILTYAYPAWSSVSDTHISLLEDVHEAALRKLSGVHGGSATNALEVLLGVLPFRLQLQQLLGKEYIKILRKPKSSRVKEVITECASTDSTILNPAKLMKVAIRDTSRQISLENLDPEPRYSEDMINTSLQKCFIPRWQELGSSHSRSAAQQDLATKSVRDHIGSLTPETLPIFTDGSALGNPGPCGSAAVIYTNGISHDPVTLSKPVALKSTSFHGEVAAVDLALSYVAKSTTITQSHIVIHSDCQAAIDSIINNSGNYTALHQEIRKNILTLNNKSIKVELCWVPGHAGIQANEIADNEAKKAAETARSWTATQDNCPVTVKEAQQVLSKELLRVWQRQWDNQTTGRFTHSILPNVKLNRHKLLQRPGKQTLRTGDVRLNRITVGHTLLRAHHLQQSLDRRLGNNPNTLCDCGEGPQDLQHFLLECPTFKEERQHMSQHITEAILRNSNCKVTKLSVQLLIGDNDDIPKEVKVAIRQAVLKFLSATAMDISI